MAKKASAFNKVIGYTGIVDELKTLCDQIKNSEKFEAVGARIPKNLLLLGMPGIGKTLLATCVIEECGIPVFTVRKSQKDMCDIITEAFEKAAECEKAFVFLDDMDKLSDSDRRGRHPNTDEYVCIQSLIDDYRDSNVFVIATVNEPRRLPDSLLRAQRFDIQIDCPLPDFDSRVKIVDSFLKKKNCSKKVNAKKVTNILGERSVAVLESVINQAALLTAYEGKEEIDEDNIIKATLKVLYGVDDDDRLPDGISTNRIASHQAAHLVVAETLTPGSCNLISLGSVRGGDVFEISKEDDYWADVEFMRNRVTMLLAGKAGIEIVYGVPAVNVCGDIDRAFNIARRFAEVYGCDGFDGFSHRRQASDYKLSVIEKKTVSVIKDCYATAKKILLENRDFLEVATERLLKDNVLTGFEISEMKNEVMKARKEKAS